MPELVRAYDYPYQRPGHSFVVTPGIGWEPAADDMVLSLAVDRTPVLACGSNGAPSQLARKFVGTTAPIPVLATGVVDHDTVFTAHITTYGAVPAALEPSPGTTVTAHVTFLTDEQLVRMDATEFIGVDYDRCVADVELTAALDGLPPLEHYAALTPPLRRHGRPVAHAAVDADQRTFEAWTQRAVLRAVTGSDDLDAAVARLQTDPDHRHALETRLQDHPILR